jgi:hypothetical protein
MFSEHKLLDNFLHKLIASNGEVKITKNYSFLIVYSHETFNDFETLQMYRIFKRNETKSLFLIMVALVLWFKLQILVLKLSAKHQNMYDACKSICFEWFYLLFIVRNIVWIVFCLLKMILIPSETMLNVFSSKRRKKILLRSWR